MAGLVLHDAAEDDSGKLLKPTLESDNSYAGLYHFVKRPTDETKQVLGGRRRGYLTSAKGAELRHCLLTISRRTMRTAL